MLKNLGRRMSALFAPRPVAGATGPQTLATVPGRDDERQPDAINRKFSREMFARLLIELPAHRQAMSTAYAAGNQRRLRDCVHQLLGAAAYCDAPELEDGLRELHLALKTEHPPGIDGRFQHAIGVIDSTLASSGYHGP